MRIAVVALGKIGLPLAVHFADAGHQVVGADVDPSVVDLVNAGIEPFPGEANLQEKLARNVASGRLRATTNTRDAVAQADAVVVVVPLFVGEEGVPDFGWLDSATHEVAKGLKPGTLVSYETTLPVGTTRNRWRPMLEEGSGLVEGRDFHLVFSPERVLTGRVFEDLRKYPKLIGALSDQGASHARAFYEAVLTFDERPDLARPNGVWDLGTAESAEMAKLAETTYRDVNIGLANQFAQFADINGIDIYKVIQASNSQPYSHIHLPGIAVGGHCIPVYPRLYLWTDPDATIVSSARAANAAMPSYAVDLLEQMTGSLAGKRIAVLGAAYRGGVKETAFSGVFPVVAELRARGADVAVHDPLFTDEELSRLGFSPYHLGEQVDLAVLQADHTLYRALTPDQLPGVTAIVDGRHSLSRVSFEGIVITSIGEGSLALGGFYQDDTNSGNPPTRRPIEATSHTT